jgi:DNA-binding NarL/FixJ family response regulator
MQPLNVVLLQSDPGTVESLVASLYKSFRSVRQAPCLSDLRSYLTEYPEGIVIMDMEIASTFDVQHLSHDFPEARIICNHRLADEEMWTATLSAGAADCCTSYDTSGILRAALQDEAATRMAA